MVTTSLWSIPQTMRTNDMVDHWGFPSQVARNRSRSSLRTSAVYYIICWQPSTSTWQHSHPIASCFWSLLLPVVQTVFNSASRVRFSVAAFAALRWTRWCQSCIWVATSGVMDSAPIVLLDSSSLSPRWGVCGAMICWCGSDEMMITKRSGKS